MEDRFQEESPFSRTELLLGAEAMEKLSRTAVIVFGIGGVGSHCIEALARCGVGRLDLDNGLILTDGVYSSETVSQVIIGLSAVGVDAETDSRFVRNGSGLVTALGSFSIGGGYAHLAGDKVNPMASEQGLCATAAYNLYKKGSQPLYYPENFGGSEEISPVSVLDRLLGVILYEK